MLYKMISRMCIEQLIKHLLKPSQVIYNTSDGVLINGSERIKLDEYMKLKEFENTDLFTKRLQFDKKDWSESLHKCSDADFSLFWKARDPRPSILELTKQLKNILSESGHSFEYLLEKVFDITNYNGKPIKRQTYIRIIRGFVNKALLSIYQQRIVYDGKVSDDQLNEFEVKSKKLLIDYLQLIQKESFDLFHLIESKNAIS